MLLEPEKTKQTVPTLLSLFRIIKARPKDSLKHYLLKYKRSELNCRISHLDETVSEADAIAEVVGPGEVAVEGGGVELCEDVHLVDPAVDAVAHGHVDEPVRAAYRHLSAGSTSTINACQII